MQILSIIITLTCSVILTYTSYAGSEMQCPVDGISDSLDMPSLKTINSLVPAFEFAGMLKHRQDVHAVAIFKNGIAASGGEDSLIKIWDFNTNSNIQVLSGHTGLYLV